MIRQGFTIWLTGLPCSGKTTLARELEHTLKSIELRAEVLDGDEVRKRLGGDVGFSKSDRDAHVRRMAYIAQLLTRVGAVAIVAAISPYRDARDQARAEIVHFVEVYVQCSFEECVNRDVKGLYAKALSGKVPNFTGVSDPYEPPSCPELIVNTERERPEDCTRNILNKLIELGYLTEDSGQSHSSA
jgi:adenylylsulfate kinase